MAILGALRRWVRVAPVALLALFLATVAAVVVDLAAYLADREPVWAWRTDVGLHLVLLGGLLAAALAWGVAFARRRVRFGTSAGFWVAGLALAARSRAEFYAHAWGTTPTDLYDASPGVAAMVWFHRNVALAAFAFGLAFVALACRGEARIRSEAPEWLRPHV